MNRNRNKNVLLIGGRSKAISMASSLLEQGYRVTVINDNYDDCLKLAEIKGLTVIYGNGTKPYILDEALASSFDIAIALTSKDEDNLVASQLCKKSTGSGKRCHSFRIRTKQNFFIRWG